MKVQINLSCDAALELMSPFIDSMVSVEEAESLRSHLSECRSCRRQLQSFVSLRNLMAGVDGPAVPEDLQLETRVRLSHERLRSARDWWQARVDNILKPFAMPAALGVIITVLGFGIVFGSFARSRREVAEAQSASLVDVYQLPRTTDHTLRRIGAVRPGTELDSPLSVQFGVNKAGRVDDMSIIGGTRSAGVDQWLQELVLLSQFRPATTYWGLPVRSQVILSFVTVRG